MIAAANVVPDLGLRRSITAESLTRLQEPALIFEYVHTDSDGVNAYVYTVAGWLNGRNIATREGGCVVGGEAIIVHADTRDAADAMAGMGLLDTIQALHDEARRYADANDALRRLHEVSAVRRLELALATPANKSDAFVEDSEAVRPLVGDDIVLTVGKVH